MAMTYHCDCGWMSIARTMSINSKCEWCGKPIKMSEIQEMDDALAVINYAEIKSRFIRETADKTNFVLFKQSKKIWLVLSKDSPYTLRYQDDKVGCVTSYTQAFRGSFAACTAFLKNRLPDAKQCLHDKHEADPV